MKKTNIILALLAFLPFSKAFAQVGEIIYRDFEPDLYVGALTYPFPHDTIRVDIDQDGTTDFAIFIGTRSGMIVGQFTNYSPWYYRCKIGENDSVVSEGSWFTLYGRPNEFTFYESPTIINDTFGFRKIVDGSEFYAWVTVEVTREIQAIHNSHGTFDKIRAYVKEAAYCTIPNYPLRWGQTSLTDGIGEMESTASKLHPNPTTGTVHIEGEKPTEVQVFNALGQLLKTVQNTSEVSLEELPQGVYVLRVTLENGKVFSDKVVKE